MKFIIGSGGTGDRQEESQNLLAGQCRYPSETEKAGKRPGGVFRVSPFDFPPRLRTSLFPKPGVPSRNGNIRTPGEERRSGHKYSAVAGVTPLSELQRESRREVIVLRLITHNLIKPDKT